VESFRIALRCIKLWAKKRAIYANVFGFFGGVAWALAVARVCQLYPNVSASTIVSKFFRIMQQWAWPQPVLLKPIEEANLGLRTWNPKIYAQDRGHRMPIITPAYPSMCATHNVTSSTQQVKLREFERAADLTDRVMIGKAKWSELFEKHDFFTRYKYYLQVIASSDSADTQLLWSGMVESRLRQLVMKLEMVEDIELAHPFIKGYDQVVKCKTEKEKHDAAHGIFLGHPEVAKTDLPSADLAASSDSLVAATLTPSKADKNGNITPSTKPESEEEQKSTSVYITCLYIGLSVKKKDPSAGPRKLDISWPIQEFTRLVKGWEKFDETSMAIVVRYIKRFAPFFCVFASSLNQGLLIRQMHSGDLPLDVFEGEEPVKQSKKKKTGKRKQSAVSGESNGEPSVTEAKRAKMLPEEEPDLPEPPVKGNDDQKL
jgi:poly(A) polymerase